MLVCFAEDEGSLFLPAAAISCHAGAKILFMG